MLTGYHGDVTGPPEESGHKERCQQDDQSEPVGVLRSGAAVSVATERLRHLLSHGLQTPHPSAQLLAGNLARKQRYIDVHV